MLWGWDALGGREGMGEREGKEEGEKGGNTAAVLYPPLPSLNQIYSFPSGQHLCLHEVKKRQKREIESGSKRLEKRDRETAPHCASMELLTECRCDYRGPCCFPSSHYLSRSICVNA